MAGYTNENEDFWYFCSCRLAWWVYAEPKSEFTKLIKAKNWGKILLNPEYVKEVFSIRYRLNIDNIIKSIDEHKGQVERSSNYKTPIEHKY